TRALFQKIREMKGKFKPRVGMLNNQQGNTLTDQDEIKGRWKQYTEELYKRDIRMTDSFTEEPYDEEPEILECKVKAALKILGRNKSPEIDGIPIELLQATETESVHILKKICQEIWKTKQWPTDWNRSIYIPIPKKGDPRECSNYQTIALISRASKVMLKILQQRLLPYMEREMPDVQAGFRKGRGTRDHTANIRWIMEQTKEFQKKITLCFIDYIKAFGCV
ncbi:uncharacterized protein LOC133389608, partial [Rhineura floridana]|uniref:uncharacterized protein LOC133389608 n=1 Tax=Rhineura floridana TaxID=261503 RepID=UPI002AC7F510